MGSTVNAVQHALSQKQYWGKMRKDFNAWHVDEFPKRTNNMFNVRCNNNTLKGNVNIHYNIQWNEPQYAHFSFYYQTKTLLHQQTLYSNTRIGLIKNPVSILLLFIPIISWLNFVFGALKNVHCKGVMYTIKKILLRKGDDQKWT